MRRSLSLVCLLLLVSCGGSGTSSAGEGGTGGGENGPGPGPGDDELGDMMDEPVVEHRGNAVETIGISGPSTPWASMSRMDREMYMVGKVLPIMNQLFAEQFPTRYSDGHAFTCATCHGPDGAARNWAMPSGSLMPLPAFGSPASAALASSMPESMRFMRETVTPTMGTLLGIEGYRCSGCHTSVP